MGQILREGTAAGSSFGTHLQTSIRSHPLLCPKMGLSQPSAHPIPNPAGSTCPAGWAFVTTNDPGPSFTTHRRSWATFSRSEISTVLTTASAFFFICSIFFSICGDSKGSETTGSRAGDQAPKAAAQPHSPAASSELWPLPPS